MTPQEAGSSYLGRIRTPGYGQVVTSEVQSQKIFNGWGRGAFFSERQMGTVLPVHRNFIYELENLKIKE